MPLVCRSLILATKNPGKIKEIKEKLKDFPIQIESLADYSYFTPPQETGKTFLANALLKAWEASHYFNKLVLADDSGLEVDYLKGAPGVYSARYAGPQASDTENCYKLLHALKDVPWEKRNARFRCIMVLYDPLGRWCYTEGIWQGIISQEFRGEQGFGYDPIFYIPGLKKTAAEIPLALKNNLSHRAQALNKIIKILPQFLSF